MKDIIKLGSLSLVTAMVLVGCGSSSDSSSNFSDNSNQNDEVLETKTGYFLDSAVVGADYITSSELNGTTDEFGRFKYKDGDKVKLYIGKLLLGEVEPTDEGLITPKSLASQSEDSEKAETLILRVLQSLDSDSNATNGITIDSTTKESFASIDKEVNILSLESEERLTDIPEIGTKIDRDNDGIIDVNATDANAHFEESISTWNDGHRPDENEVENSTQDTMDDTKHEDGKDTNNVIPDNNQTDNHVNRPETDNGKDSDRVTSDNNHENSSNMDDTKDNDRVAPDNNQTDNHENRPETDNGKDSDRVTSDNNHENSSNMDDTKDNDSIISDNNQTENNQTESHGNRPEIDNGKDNDTVTSDNNQTDNHGDGLNLDDYTKSTLTTEQKYSLAYMWNEEKLAYDVYSELNKVQPQKQLENIATRSEVKHIQMVEDLVQRYDINISNLDTYEIKYSESELRALPVGSFGVEDIQTLYNKLYDKGIKSGQDALEVGCMVEVTDVNDLNKHIETAQTTNSTDIIDTFDKLRSGSYNHYWSFDKGLKNMGITDGCCSLGTIDGVNYCQPDYPQNEKDNNSTDEASIGSQDSSNTEDSGEASENTGTKENREVNQGNENSEGSESGSKNGNGGKNRES